jgi:hypothetical protein
MQLWQTLIQSIFFARLTIPHQVTFEQLKIHFSELADFWQVDHLVLNMLLTWLDDLFPTWIRKYFPSHLQPGAFNVLTLFSDM